MFTTFFFVFGCVVWSGKLFWLPFSLVFSFLCLLFFFVFFTLSLFQSFSLYLSSALSSNIFKIKFGRFVIYIFPVFSFSQEFSSFFYSFIFCRESYFFLLFVDVFLTCVLRPLIDVTVVASGSDNCLLLVFLMCTTSMYRCFNKFWGHVTPSSSRAGMVFFCLSLYLPFYRTFYLFFFYLIRLSCLLTSFFSRCVASFSRNTSNSNKKK